VRGGSEVEVAHNTLSLSQYGEVLPKQLPRSSIGVQNELTPRCAPLGRDGLVVWISVQVLGVCGVLLPLWDNDGDLQKVIQCLGVEANDFPPNPTELGCVVL